MNGKPRHYHEHVEAAKTHLLQTAHDYDDCMLALKEGWDPTRVLFYLDNMEASLRRARTELWQAALAGGREQG